RALAGRAQAARERLQLLYDAGVRIGTTLDVVRTAEELAQVAVPRFADVVSVELLDGVMRGGEPSEDTAEMRRTAVMGVEREDVFYPVGELIRFVPSTPMARSMSTGRAVLEADLGAVGAWRMQDPERARRILEYGTRSLISVPLSARGVVLGLANFWRMESTGTFESEDLSTAEELAARAAVAIDNARRFTRERTIAATTQRRLLPQSTGQCTALDTAWLHLPADGGASWFDTIALPGARTALVTGNTSGQGISAATTMGQLRTAIHALAALDLEPDELLARLHDTTGRLAEERAALPPADPLHKETLTASCLYGIYDPITRTCTLACAGHPAPIIVHPDGSTRVCDVPAGTPLGSAENL
ncbi:PP2C family protein-serine/threonine phosphatase, partial [Streptomyces sp. NPDC001939]